MRKFVISLLLASAVAAPAIAAPRDWSDRHQAHEDRQPVRESHQQAHQERAQVREERVQGAADRPSFAGASRAPQVQAEQRQEMAARQFSGDRGGRAQAQVQERRGMFGGDRSDQRDAFAAQRRACGH